MKYQPKGTLAYFKSAPQFHRVSLVHIPTNHFAAATKKYRETCGTAQPDTEAISFYALNHLASLVEKNFTLHEPLPQWAVDVYQAHLNAVSQQGNRMWHYLVSISVREMRHIKAHTGMAEPFLKKAQVLWGESFKVFLEGLPAAGEDGAAGRYMSKPPDCTMGIFLKGLAWAFHTPKWSGSYGGKKWGNIVDTCLSFVEGKTSLEALVDTAYTLQHNSCSIFNKPLIYASYSHSLQTILDIQRSGQIPELILDSKKYGVSSTYFESDVVALVKSVLAQYPKEFRGWVDWFQIEKLGALGNYGAYKEQQKKDHPVPVEPVKPVVKTQKVGNAVMKFYVTGKWDVSPGIKVNKIERVHA